MFVAILLFSSIVLYCITSLPIAGIPSPSILSFTLRAKEVALEEIARQAKAESKQSSDYDFRVGLRGGGCNGFEYYVAVDFVKADDYVFAAGDLKVAIDQKSAAFLDDAVVDYLDTMMEKKFVFKNPNATGSCGCGTSVSF